MLQTLPSGEGQKFVTDVLTATVWLAASGVGATLTFLKEIALVCELNQTVSVTCDLISQVVIVCNPTPQLVIVCEITPLVVVICEITKEKGVTIQL